MRLFKGIECEGPFKGKVTLFVEGIPDHRDAAMDTLGINASTLEIEHIYFGANYKVFTDKPSDIDTNYILSLAQKIPHTPITVETTFNEVTAKRLFYPDLKNIYVVFTIASLPRMITILRYFSNSSVELKQRAFIKFVTDSDVWIVPIYEAACTLKTTYGLLNDTLLTPGENKDG